MNLHGTLKHAIAKVLLTPLSSEEEFIKFHLVSGKVVYGYLGRGVGTCQVYLHQVCEPLTAGHPLITGIMTLITAPQPPALHTHFQR